MPIELLKRHMLRMLLSAALVLVFLAHVAGFVEFEFARRLENFAYDARLLLTMPRDRDTRVVIVDIDERSLAAEGRWPWGRDKLARMVDKLFDHYEAGLVAFDVVFAEPDQSSGLHVLEGLAETVFKGDERYQKALWDLRPRLDNDSLFAASLQDRPVILGYYFSDLGEQGEAPKAGELPSPLFSAGQFTGRNIAWVKARGFGANLGALQSNAYAAGHFNPFVDEDGVVRRVPMLYEFEGQYYESLSLAVARTALGVENVHPGYPEESRAGQAYSGLEWLEVGDRLIPVDGRVRTLVPYRGPQGSFPYISATDVLSGKAPVDALRGRIVLVGTSAPGLLDLRSAPVEKVFPGVEIHANLVTGILDNSIKANPAYTLGAEFVILILAGLVMVLLLPFLTPLMASVVTLAVLVLVSVVNLYIWNAANLVLPVATTLLMVVVLYVFHMAFGYFVESRGKRQLAGLFGQYVPPELVEEMGRDPDSYSMEGESREMTVLFSDVRSFTTMSEGLEPRELSRLMNEFLTPMTRVIHNHRGTIDKYMGDAIMAFWGAPLDDPDHARHALEAGMAMLAELRRLQPHFTAQGWPEIRIGVGVNTGEMNVGNMGSEFRMAYTVMGDAVNLGSRLEGLTKGYGVQIIVNETTREAIPDYIYRELDRVRVKGKDRPVTIYEPVGPADEVDRETRAELKLYRESLKLYRAGNWDMAEIQFLNLKQRNPGRRLYALYAERVAHYRKQPPPTDWDGVFTHQTK